MFTKCIHPTGGDRIQQLELEGMVVDFLQFLLLRLLQVRWESYQLLFLWSGLETLAVGVFSLPYSIQL